MSHTNDRAAELGVWFDQMTIDAVFAVRTEPYTEEELAMAQAWIDSIKALKD